MALDFSIPFLTPLSKSPTHTETSTGTFLFSTFIAASLSWRQSPSWYPSVILDLPPPLLSDNPPCCQSVCFKKLFLNHLLSNSKPEYLPVVQPVTILWTLWVHIYYLILRRAPSPPTLLPLPHHGFYFIGF